jgi:transcriptional regulator with XRE-family HTH domain
MDGFGERLVTLREAKGWTRRELAKRAGLHEKHLDKVEHGARQRIEAETIIKLSRTLGVSSDFLLGLTDDPRPRPRRTRQRDGTDEDDVLLAGVA